MTTINALLATRNELAARLDVKSIASWKASKAKLQEQIDEFTARLTPTRKRDDLFHLTDLCRELGMNAKVARAKARRLYAKDDTTLPTPITKWAWDMSDQDRVREHFAK
jgi:hypothetical protein